MTIFDQKNKAKIGLILATLITATQAGCMIDMCKRCDFSNVYTCNECRSGYYLRHYFGTEKGREYQDCWKKSKLMMALFGLLLLPCLYGLCCYCLYKMAVNKIKAPPTGGGVNFKNNQIYGEDKPHFKVGAPHHPTPSTGGQITNAPPINHHAITPEYPITTPTYHTQGYRAPAQHRQVVRRAPKKIRRIIREEVIEDPHDDYYPNPAPIRRPSRHEYPRYKPERERSRHSYYPSENSSRRGSVKIIEKEPTLIIERLTSKKRSPPRRRRSKVYSTRSIEKPRSYKRPVERNTVGGGSPRFSRTFVDERDGSRYRAYRLY